MKRISRCSAAALGAALMLLSRPVAGAGTISYSYDAAGRLVSVGYPDGKSISYAYDGAGNLVQTSSPTPALMLGEVRDGQFTLAWPLIPGGFVLEWTTALGSNAVWSPVTPPSRQVGNQFVVTLPIGSTPVFYRLHR